MPNVRELLKVFDKLTEPNRFAVLVHARLLVLRQCVVLQYRHEQRVWYRAQYPHVHWVR